MTDDQGSLSSKTSKSRRRITRDDDEGKHYAGSNESGYLSTNEINDDREARNNAYNSSNIQAPQGVSNNRRWMLYKINKQNQDQQGTVGQKPGHQEQKTPPHTPEGDTMHRRPHQQEGAPQVQAQEEEEEDTSMMSAAERLKAKLGGAGRKLTAPSELSGIIGRAKEGLSSSGKPPPAPVAAQLPPKPPEPKKSESDLQWEILEKQLRIRSRALKINGIDFTDLTDVDDINILNDPYYGGGTMGPPPPSLGGLPPPPPPLGMGGPPPPPPPPGCGPPPPPPIGGPPPPGGTTALQGKVIPKNKKTIRLHWKEVRHDFKLPSGRPMDTIWSKLNREVGNVKVDMDKLEHLFETRQAEIKTKVRPKTGLDSTCTSKCPISVCFLILRENLEKFQNDTKAWY